MSEAVKGRTLLTTAQSHSNGNESKAKRRVGKNRENTMVLEFQEKGRHDVDARDRVGFQAEKKNGHKERKSVCVCE